jgi:hypothetical protein
MQVTPRAIDGEIFEYTDLFGDTRRYRLNLEDDADAPAPWDNEDGHGPVSGWERRSKRPGEMILNSDRGSHRFYDFQEAIKIARRDDWNSCNVATKDATKGQLRTDAVYADFERLRAWCRDEWRYVGVIVTPLSDNPEQDDETPTDYAYAVWGIESDCSDYIKETALELAGEHARAAATEEQEAAYWAARDVVTED